MELNRCNRDRNCRIQNFTILSTFTSLVVLLICLFGCSERRTTQNPTEGPVVELTYWPAPNPQEVQLADSIVREWNRIHPGIHVRMQPIPVSQSTEEVLLAAIAGKTTPDVCSNIWPGALAEFTRLGGLVPLDQFADFDSAVTTRTPREVVVSLRDPSGHYFQMPWKTNPVMMFYNKRIFEESGVESVPHTYSEYYAAAKKVTRAVDGNGQTRVWMGERDIRPIWWQRWFDYYSFYIAASKGRTLFVNGEPELDRQASARVFGFFQTCYSENYFPHTFFQGGDPFLLERKATNFAGPWQIPTLRTLAPGVRFGVAPIPVPDDHEGPVNTYGDYKNIALFSTTRHPKEAWEFVKFLVQAKHDLLLLRIANQIPLRSDLLSNPLFADYFQSNPLMIDFARAAVFTRSVDAAPDLKEIFDAISQEYEACAVYGKKSPVEATQATMERIKVIVDWNK
jgi:multiple sugar transport system substrate-binding protein